MADSNELVVQSQLEMVLEEEDVTLLDAPCLDASSIILTETTNVEGLHVSHYILPQEVTVAGFEEVGDEVELQSWDSLTSSSSAASSFGQDSGMEVDTNPDVFLAFVDDHVGPVTLLAPISGNLHTGGEVIVQRMYEMKDDVMLSQVEAKDEDYFSEKESCIPYEKTKVTPQIVKVFIRDDKRLILKEEDEIMLKEDDAFHEDQFLQENKSQEDDDDEGEDAGSDSENLDGTVGKGDGDEYIFHCAECDLTFSSNKSFESHMEDHLIRLQNSCALCDKEFGSKSSLQEHIKDHFIKSTSVSCDICKKEFMSKPVLKRHKKQIHNTNEPLITSLKCEVCNSVFSSKFSLKSHSATHSTRKPFTCKECGATFTQNGSLQVHLRRHRGEKPFKCDICGNNFTRAHSLKVHMKTHTGEKPYTCEYCGACFVTSSHLTVHRRTHTGERPYSCNECGATFITTSHLNVHRRLHNSHTISTTNKSISCTLCGASFDDLGRLRHHRRTEHKGTLKKFQTGSYRCKICNKKFTTQSQLRNHSAHKCC